MGQKEAGGRGQGAGGKPPVRDRKHEHRRLVSSGKHTLHKIFLFFTATSAGACTLCRGVFLLLSPCPLPPAPLPISQSSWINPLKLAALGLGILLSKARKPHKLV